MPTEKKASLDSKFDEACIAGKINSDEAKKIARIADPKKRAEAIKALLEE